MVGKGKTVKRLVPLTLTALAMIAIPPEAHANGFDSWYRGIVIWFFLVPFATCCAGLAYALRYGRSHWALLYWPVLAGLGAAAFVSVLMGGFGFAGPLLPCAIMFCGMGLVLGLVALAVKNLRS